MQYIQVKLQMYSLTLNQVPTICIPIEVIAKPPSACNIPPLNGFRLVGGA